MTPVTYRTLTACRICGSTDLTSVVDLGAMPLANAFVSPDRAGYPEPRYPLEAIRCGRCSLMQLSVVVRPEILFTDYAYATSASAPAVEHFDALAAELVERFVLADRLVVEIGSNDGVLLAPLVARGARALGIEPAANLAATASARSLETLNELFSAAGARRIAKDRGPARLVVANNVLAHIDDLGEVVAGLDALLDDDGVFVAEFPYVADLLERVEYDTIYHEHLSYFALAPLRRLFGSAGMELFDVSRLPEHGGSVRVYVGRSGRREVSDEIARLIAAEEQSGLLTPGPYARFGERVRRSRTALREMLAGLRERGARVAGLGATAKGNTLLNYCGIRPDTVVFIADSTPQKQGRLTPGMRIPVRPEGAIMAERPQYTLLLAWNYADAILEKFAPYIAEGGRFIHPVPIARVLP